MAKIPLTIAQQRLETGSVLQYPSGSPVGGVLRQVGGELGQAGARLRAQNEQMEADAQQKVRRKAEIQQRHDDEINNFTRIAVENEMDQALAGDFEAAQQDMPIDGRGFSQLFAGDIDPATGAVLKPGLFDERIKAYRERIPESERERFDLRVPALRQEYLRRSSHAADVQERAYFANEIEKITTTLTNGIGQSDPNDIASYQQFVARGEEAINAARLTPLEKEQLVTKWRATAAETLFQSALAKDPTFAARAREALGLASAEPATSSTSSIVDRIIGVESGGRANAKNPNSSATGLGQFTSSTWMATVRKYEPELGAGRTRAQVLALRNDGAISRRMTGHLVEENSQALRSAGVPVNDGTVYLAHFAGSAGAVRLLRADPDASAESVLGSAVVNANPFLRSKTASDVIAWAARKMGSAAPSSAGAPDPQFANIPFERRLALAGDAEVISNRAIADAQQEATATYQAQMNELETQIFDKKAGFAEIQTARETWLTDADDIQSLTTLVESRNKEAIALQEAFGALADPVKVWDPTDSDDKKRVDLLFGADNGQQRIVGQDQSYVDTVVLPLVEKTSMVPRAVKGALSGMMRSTDPTTLSWALGTMDQIERSNPEAFARDMGEDALRKLMVWREESPFRKPDEIAEIMRSESDPATAEARKTLVAEGRKKATEVSDGEILQHFDPSMFSSGPDAPIDPLANASLRVQFDSLFANEFARTGDTDRAKENALKLLENQWGTSDVTGERRLMRYPPEKTGLPRVGGSYDWMAEQARTELDAIIPEGGAFGLASDARTEAEIGRGQSPSYQIIVRDQFGAFNAVSDEQNRAARFSFDPKPFEERARVEFQRQNLERELQEIEAPVVQPRGAGARTVAPPNERAGQIRGELDALPALEPEKPPRPGPAALPQYDAMGNPTGF